MFNPIAPYRYLPPNLYLSVADIAIQTCLRVFVGPGFVSTSPAFMRSSTSHTAGPHDWLFKKNGNRALIAGGGSGRHNFNMVCHATVTDPSRVGSVFWIQINGLIPNIHRCELSTQNLLCVGYNVLNIR